jgi:D-lactate dehydrogenase
MPAVIFYEAFAEEAAAIRRLLPAGIDATYTDRTIQESGDAAPPAPVISVRTQSRLPTAWAPKLTAILSRSTGYDHLQAYAVAVAPAAGPALGYLPLYCHRAVAEQALLLWLALLRRLPRQMKQFRTFHRDHLTGGECAGRTLAVVGVGWIGAEVARLGAALGMRVLGVDRAPRFTDIAHVPLGEALAQADIVVCAMDLNPSNRGFFDAARWRQVKPGALFVNISRGELSPAVDLLAALASGQLAGVGLDVYNQEAELAVALRSGSPTSDHPEVQATLALARRDDVICTPHNAFNTAEAVERKSEHSVRQLVALRDTGRFLWDAPPP